MAHKINTVEELRKIANSAGKNQPITTILKRPEQAALFSKLVRSPLDRGIYKPSEAGSESGLLNAGIDQISKTTMAHIEDNENVFRLFPDLELAVQIIISSILSPKDMLETDLIYKVDSSWLPSQVTAKLVEIVRKELSTHYKLEEDLHAILRNALFKKGSHVRLILPESAVDEIINQRTAVAVEDIHSRDIYIRDTSGAPVVKHLGILGDSNQPSTRRISALESIGNATSMSYNGAPAVSATEFHSEFLKGIYNFNAFKEMVIKNVEVADNFHLLKMPRLIERLGKDRLSQMASSSIASVVATEAFSNDHPNKNRMSPSEISSAVYKSGKTEYKPFIRVQTTFNLRRKSIGRPLVMTLPSEAAIPVFVPGSPSEHLGYFIPTDVDGNPVTVDSVAYDTGYGLSSMLQADRSNSTSSSLLTEKARKNLSGDSYVPMIDHLSEIYADILETDLLERISRGVYNRRLATSRNNEIYRIMLSRTLAGQYTRLIYVPNDYVVYYAFNYHRNGVGKSYLDDLSNITSLRAMVLFSKVMAKVKSSITTTKVNMQLDERDRDPIKTIEMAKHLIARARQQYFPHGLNRVVDLTDWIQRAGIEIGWEAHPMLPNTKFDIESKNIQHTLPDDDLDETLRHQQYMHLGLSPETVDSATKTDFATTIEQNSILFARRIKLLSDIFSKHLSDDARKLVKHDQEILKQLYKTINESMGEIEKVVADEDRGFFESDKAGFIVYVIETFVNSINLDLPKPNSTSIENQDKAIDAMETRIDKALTYIFSPEVLPDTIGGEASQYIDALKTAWKAHLMRAWMAENNFMPEAFAITNSSDEGKPMANLLEAITSYSESVLVNITEFLSRTNIARYASDKDIAKMAGSGDEVGGGEGGTGTGEETPTGGEEGPTGTGEESFY